MTTEKTNRPRMDLPGMQIIPHRDLNAGDAQAITRRIRSAIGDVMMLVAKAYQGRVWLALGYESWPDYIRAEFSHAPLALPREERRAVVALLRGQGLSTRAIGAATGHHYSTISRELGGVANATPAEAESADEDALAEKLIAAEPPGGLTDSTPGRTGRVNEALERARGKTGLAPVIGLDGKRYQPKPPPEPAAPSNRSRRRPLPEVFGETVSELTRVTKRIEALTTDARFEKNAGQMAPRVSDLARAHDALQRVLDKFDGACHAPE